ncbi:RDD family protein [Luteolibacter sp. GHJ8]|uniref:RDD family protein n=1 Tax=Luteolibacter rhizosphaerae TaxID=2989719 RepID=A0ABT3G3A9_9BACT|nr:RDD family protein [Luteolibacter rhizosphaerae]MCW1914333.1 RDD family protein [Luteolibacter rhizosphaerae]
MENEPEKPQSSTPPPPPDIPPPSPASPLPMPNLAPPPPAPAPPMPDVPPPPPPATKSSEQAPKAKFDSDENDADENESVVEQLAGEAPFDTRLIAGIIDGFIAGIAILVIGKLGWVIYFAYMLLKDSLPFLDGQSLGKKLMKIRAVDSEGRSLSGNWELGIKRNILMMIPFVPLYEAYVLYQKKEAHLPLRRTGDDMAKTKVIKVKEATAA